MKFKSLMIAAAICMLELGASDAARSCTCIPPQPPPQAFAEVDAVFTGKVTAFEELESSQFPDFRLRLAHVEVIKIWKGNHSSADSVFTALHSAACGYDFLVGEEYLIYAYEDQDGTLHTTICTRTAPVREAGEDLEFLDSFSYFPLAPQNSWRFAHGVVETITDTVRTGGVLYARFDRFREFPNAWLRLSDDGKLFVRSGNEEQVWVDFNADFGETWEVIGLDGLAEWTVELQSRSDTVRVPAGTFYPCYRFYFRFHGADNDWVEWYTPNLGPVERHQIGFAFIEYPLEEAIINGKGLPSSIAEPSPVHTFKLAQNYPNPLLFAEDNATAHATVIRYHLDAPAPVELAIYDLQGRQVKMLFQGPASPGEHRALWDGRDTRGEQAPSGVYFYRLEVGRFAQVRKLVLVR